MIPTSSVRFLITSCVTGFAFYFVCDLSFISAFSFCFFLHFYENVTNSKFLKKSSLQWKQDILTKDGGIPKRMWYEEKG